MIKWSSLRHNDGRIPVPSGWAAADILSLFQHINSRLFLNVSTDHQRPAILFFSAWASVEVFGVRLIKVYVLIIDINPNMYGCIMNPNICAQKYNRPLI